MSKWHMDKCSTQRKLTQQTSRRSIIITAADCVPAPQTMALGSTPANLSLTSSTEQGPPQVPLKGSGESQPLTRAPGDTEGKYAIHWAEKSACGGSFICTFYTFLRSSVIIRFKGILNDIQSLYIEFLAVSGATFLTFA